MDGGEARNAAVTTAGAEGHWFRRREIDESLTLFTEPFVHPYFSANIWLLRGRDADLLVDTGMGLAPLSPMLTASGRPLIAVATHIHVDHVGGLHEFEHRLGPAVSAEAFADMPDALTLAHLFRGIDHPIEQSPAPNWTAAGYRLAPAPLTRALKEGDRIDLGDRSFTVLELPGHSPDCIGLYDEANGLLFGGDAIYDDELVDDLPGSDPATYRVTMERLLTLPVRIAHGGHGLSFDGERLRAIAKAYLRGRSIAAS
jgi:glyoxylase-like metal-dependent hydrolase (beta-lactamase superfamily II)